MKAEDTVMGEEEIINRVTKFHFSGSNNRHDLVRDAVKAQAGITFRVAYKQGVEDANKCGRIDRQLGIKEVVDYLVSDDNGLQIELKGDKWGKQLEEWGINED